MARMLRLERSWTRWSLRRIKRKHKKSLAQVALLREMTESTLLKIKELEQRYQMAEHRLVEMQESRQIHQQLEPPPREHTPQELMAELLGLEP